MIEWREDVKTCLLKAGLEDHPIVFLFSDVQIVEEQQVANGAAEAVAVGVAVKVIRLIWQGGKLLLVWQAAAVVGLTLMFEDGVDCLIAILVSPMMPYSYWVSKRYSCTRKYIM